MWFLLSTSVGGLDLTATIIFKSIAAQLSKRRHLPYSVVIRWIQCLFFIFSTSSHNYVA